MLRDVGAIEVGDSGLDGDLAVDLSQSAGGGLGLRKLVFKVAFVEQLLPLEVVRLDEIAVDQPNSADSGPRQKGSPHASQSADSDNGDARIRQFLLGFLAEEA